MSAELHEGPGALALRRAVRQGDLFTARALVAADSTLARTSSERGGSLVLEAYERGAPELAELLLEARDGGALVGMDVHEAAALGRPRALEHALTEDMTAFEDVGPGGFAPLHRAAYQGHAEAAALLLQMGADAVAPADNRARTSPLESAVAGAGRLGATDGHREIVRLLVAAGADPDAATADEISLRESAARAGTADLFPAPESDLPGAD